MTDKHKEALEALVVLYNAKAINTDNETMGAAYETVKQALQAASWQPIETAPRDGDTRVLIFGGFGVLAWSISDDDLPDGATHWMPLPAAPVDGGR